MSRVPACLFAILLLISSSNVNSGYYNEQKNFSVHYKQLYNDYSEELAIVAVFGTGGAVGLAGLGAKFLNDKRKREQWESEARFEIPSLTPCNIHDYIICKQKVVSNPEKNQIIRISFGIQATSNKMHYQYYYVDEHVVKRLNGEFFSYCKDNNKNILNRQLLNIAYLILNEINRFTFYAADDHRVEIVTEISLSSYAFEYTRYKCVQKEYNTTWQKTEHWKKDVHGTRKINVTSIESLRSAKIPEAQQKIAESIAISLFNKHEQYVTYS